MKKQSGLGLIGALLIIGALVITTGGVLVWQKQVLPIPTPTPTMEPQPTPEPLPTLGKNVAFETIKSWQHQDIERANYVIQNVEEWQNLWHKMYPSKETGARYALPEVDFTRKKK